MRLGGEFQANTYTTNTQVFPAVTTDGAGRFVVVWQSNGSAGSDTSGNSVQGRRYDATGTALGPDFQVNTFTTDDQNAPLVASDTAGNFVVVWGSAVSAGSDTSATSVQARRFDAAGSPLGPEFQVNTYTTYFQSPSSLVMDAAGNFIVAWGSSSSDTDESDASVHARRYDATGTPLGAQFQVNTYTTGAQNAAAIALGGTGEFFVVWNSSGSGGSDTSGFSIQARRYDASGTPVGAQFQVNTYTTGTQWAPAVTSTPGGFVVAWESSGSAAGDVDSRSIQARRYNASGTPLGPQFQVNSYTTSLQDLPNVAADADGNFLITWESLGSPGSDTSVLSVQARRFAADGAALGAQFQVNTLTLADQRLAAVATDGAGNFVVTWHGNASGGTDSVGSIRAQRLATGRPILGKRLLVRDPTGIESQRAVVALGRESPSDVGATILGDPTVSGAILRVIAHGTTASDETYLLDSGGWRTTGTAGYRYQGPTDGDGDPVRKVVLKRTPGGKALLSVVLKGSIGTQSLDVVPPNAGDDGGILLTIPGGGTYCAAFGGDAGGTESSDDGRVWKITNPTSEGCPDS